MRIFKNRGDIYFSKTDKEKTREQKILISLLVIFVAFTLVFVFVTAAKNDFSAKKFFEPNDLSTTAQTAEQTEKLPEVSGKTNCIITVSDDTNLLFVTLLQIDMDSTSYKVCTLKAATEYDGNSLKSVYSKSGIQSVKAAVESEFSAEFDYYIDFDENEFIDFFDSLASIDYALADDIKYRESDSDSPYSIRIKSGEQTIKSSQFSNLIRYYLEQEKNSSAANNLILSALLQQTNSENYEKREEIFETLAANSTTNITVRDYSAASDIFTVLFSDQTSEGVFDVSLEYSKNAVTEKSLEKAKGYFKK